MLCILVYSVQIQIDFLSQRVTTSLLGNKSIDVLVDESKECFLDLGAFPTSRKFSVDFLLDIWVYVRGMEWRDDFVVSLELASRNLLNLTSNPR
jgi:hypothetical protein